MYRGGAYFFAWQDEETEQQASELVEPERDSEESGDSESSQQKVNNLVVQ